MKKLYHENPYEKKFTSSIVDIVEKDNKFHILLDKTYFYPEGGGQPSDTGYIESNPVVYVYEEEGNIYHVVEKKPSKVKKVKCKIDWQIRYDHMQQHLGQHILSAALVEIFNTNTIGFHLGKEYSTIDIDKVISDDIFKQVEKLSNEIIISNTPVETLYPTDKELRKLSLRKLPPKTDEQIRLVKVGDIDINACCGTHPHSTVEVQMIKITKWEKYKDGMRIEFLCGKRALDDYNLKHERIREISKLLSINEHDIVQDIKRLTKELRQTNSEIKSLRNEVMEYEVKDMISEAESIKNIKIIKDIYTDVDLKYVSNMASKLTVSPNVVVLFGIETKDKANLIFARSKDLSIISMNSLLKDAISLIDGRGGGSDFSAQGGGKNNNNLGSCLEYAYNKVKGVI